MWWRVTFLKHRNWVWYLHVNFQWEKLVSLDCRHFSVQFCTSKSSRHCHEFYIICSGNLFWYFPARNHHAKKMMFKWFLNKNRCLIVSRNIQYFQRCVLRANFNLPIDFVSKKNHNTKLINIYIYTFCRLVSNSFLSTNRVLPMLIVFCGYKCKWRL